jgi:hypothetical protein
MSKNSRCAFARIGFDGGVDRPDDAAARPDPPLAGLKYADLLSKHLAKLRRAYAHGNRVLHYDDLVTAYLLAFFNPTARSLRTIEDLSRTPAMRGRVGPPRLCRSTLSDAAALFDPRLLAPLVARLRARLPDLRRRDGDLARLLGAVTVVDGSFFAAAADVAWALTRRHGRGDAQGPPRAKVRLDLHLDGRTLTPRALAVSGKGAADSEPRSAARLVERGAVYVCDRGYVAFATGSGPCWPAGPTWSCGCGTGPTSRPAPPSRSTPTTGPRACWATGSGGWAARPTARRRPTSCARSSSPTRPARRTPRRCGC